MQITLLKATCDIFYSYSVYYSCDIKINDILLCERYQNCMNLNLA